MISLTALSRRLGAGVLALLVWTALAEPAQAGTAEAAGEFLERLKDQAVERLTDESLPQEERQVRFRELFREHFDLPTIGRFVLARYWRVADESTREAFLGVFEDLMVQRFAPQFAGYEDSGFTVTGVRSLPEDGQYMVSTRFHTPEGKRVQVDWRVREAGESFKILDVVGEGVSMALTLRSEYGSAIKNAGGKVEALVELLRDRVRDGTNTG